MEFQFQMGKWLISHANKKQDVQKISIDNSL